jgi:hypothetical protein
VDGTKALVLVAWFQIGRTWMGHFFHPQTQLQMIPGLWVPATLSTRPWAGDTFFRFHVFSVGGTGT